MKKTVSDPLSVAERARYARQLVLPGMGVVGQQRLQAARVLVVGAGGLGCPVLQYLAAAGVGHIGIADGDRVAMSNLHRQILYTEADTGEYKVDAAATRLRAMNRHISIATYPVFVDRDNVRDLLAPYTIIVDGTDNFRTRYLLNDACVLLDKTLVYGAIFRYEGQVAVFNHALADPVDSACLAPQIDSQAQPGGGQRSPNYRDLFPLPPDPGTVPDCATGGVWGVLPGVMGGVQANEVLKLITGVGVPLAGKLWLYDAATLSSRTLSYKARPGNRITELIDYVAFCDGLHAGAVVAEIDGTTLENWTDYALLDVRTAAERAHEYRGGIHIPLAELPERRAEIPDQRPLVVYCQSGKRSQRAIQMVWPDARQRDRIYSLRGGLHSWPNKF